MGFHKVLTNPPTHALSPVIPPNARDLCLTAAAGTELAGAYSYSTFIEPRKVFYSYIKAVYNPEAVILHAAWLVQDCSH